MTADGCWITGLAACGRILAVPTLIVSGEQSREWCQGTEQSGDGEYARAAYRIIPGAIIALDRPRRDGKKRCE